MTRRQLANETALGSTAVARVQTVSYLESAAHHHDAAAETGRNSLAKPLLLQGGHSAEGSL